MDDYAKMMPNQLRKEVQKKTGRRASTWDKKKLLATLEVNGNITSILIQNQI